MAVIIITMKLDRFHSQQSLRKEPICHASQNPRSHKNRNSKTKEKINCAPLKPIQKTTRNPRFNTKEKLIQSQRLLPLLSWRWRTVLGGCWSSSHTSRRPCRCWAWHESCRGWNLCRTLAQTPSCRENMKCGGCKTLPPWNGGKTITHTNRHYVQKDRSGQVRKPQ